MTTGKTQTKTIDNGAKRQGPSPEALKIAHEIHTLAQMLRARIALPDSPWAVPQPPMTRFESPMAWMAPAPQDAAQPWAVPTHWPW